MTAPKDTIRAVIIDDDPFMIDLLSDKISKYFPELTLIGTAGNGTTGLALIVDKQPALVFLDVEMTDMTGFEMLEKITDHDFEVIFITAYRHYAIKAIRFSALDYLVKPIDLEELKAAINRFKRKRGKTEDTRMRIASAKHNLITRDDSDKILHLQTQDGEMRLKIGDIVRIEAERNYSYIHLVSGKKKLTSKNLGEFEDLLSDRTFFRTHRSHLINRSHIIQVEDKWLICSDNYRTPVSRRKKKPFKDWYQTS